MHNPPALYVIRKIFTVLWRRNHTGYNGLGQGVASSQILKADQCLLVVIAILRARLPRASHYLEADTRLRLRTAVP